MLLLGFLQVHAEVEESLEVVAGGYQRPFEIDLVFASRLEAPEADGLLDDAKHGFDGLLAQSIELLASRCI